MGRRIIVQTPAMEGIEVKGRIYLAADDVIDALEDMADQAENQGASLDSVHTVRNLANIFGKLERKLRKGGKNVWD